MVFVAHGAQKLFGWFGGGGFAAEIGEMQALGLEPAWLWAFLGGAGEFGGGLLVLLGLMTPLGAAAIAGVMAGATVTTTGPNGFFIQNEGFEYNLVLIVICAALVLTGAGAYSLDRVLVANGGPMPAPIRFALRQEPLHAAGRP